MLRDFSMKGVGLGRSELLPGRAEPYSLRTMDGRHYHNSLRRLRLFAGEADLTGETVSKIVQPFIEEWRSVSVPNVKDGAAPMDADLRLSEPALVDLSARIRAIGMNLNKSGVRG